ncbi:MAG: type I restriction endonuclease subunit M [Haloarculaceae archaeon]
MCSPLAAVPVDALRERYGAAARQRLRDGGRLADAFETWRSFVRESHGDVFAGLAADGEAAGPAAERVFVDALTVDFLLDGLLDAIEDCTGVTIVERDPGAGTGALDVGFGELHDEVLAPSEGRDRVRAAVGPDDLRALGPDDLGALYRRVVDRQVRHALGEYYTPLGVAALGVDAVAGPDFAEATLLDPGCGAGAFLVAAIERKRAALTATGPDAVVDAVTGSVAGVDLNPVAVRSAQVAYAAALFDELAAAERATVELPVTLTDALGLTRDDPLVLPGTGRVDAVDVLAGNPPWVPWERLADRVKARFRERYVDELGLQPHAGAAARLGHSNDDVSIPYAWTCVHRYLRDGGAAAFVLKRDAVRGPAGAVLRRLRVGDRSLALEGVQDLAALSPFADGRADAAVYAFRAEAEPSFPVEATVWTPDGKAATFGSLSGLRDATERRQTQLVPLDRAEPASAWLRADADRAALGECAHDIRHGLKDDASAVFGLDRADLENVDAETVYPYLRSRHVGKYGVSGHDLRLVPQRRAGEDNEDELRREHPATYAYLDAHREALTDRKSSWLDQGPFYSVFGLGPYTWADYKVVWCRLNFKPDFAVVSTRTDPDLGERPVVPGDHYMFVATDDREAAHFLCALLNAAPYQRTLSDIAGGKAGLSKAVVSELALPPYSDTERRRRLAALSVRAHERVAAVADGAVPAPDDDPELAAIQAEIDRLVEAGLAAGAFG